MSGLDYEVEPFDPFRYDEGDDGVVELVIAAPLPHQEALDLSPASRKLGRAGRRGGKTRWIFKAAVCGHGPEVLEREEYIGRRGGKPVYRTRRLAAGEPLHRGIIHGKDIAWCVPVYKTANAVWEEEVLPRFRPLVDAGVAEINQSDRFVQLRGLGRLFIVTGENIDAIRGIGKNLQGVIYDEAAHANLKYAHLNVLVPMLTDNRGWLAYMSTTNSGLDGNQEKEVPSYFNRLCHEVQQGLRGPEWAEFHFTAHDNASLDPIAVDAMIAEYVPGSIQLEEEVYAKLLNAGAGIAFPEWHRTAHVRSLEPEAGWKPWAGMDWGYSKPGAFYVGYSGPDRVLVRHEIYFNGDPRPDWPKKADAVKVGQAIGHLLRRISHAKGPGMVPEVIIADSAMWAVVDGGLHIAGKVQEGIEAGWGGPYAPQLMPSPKGPGSRVARKQLVHELLAYEKQEGTDRPKIEAWPMLAVHPDCQHLTRTLPALTLDKLNLEDVDSDGEDHPYDAVTYPLLAQLPEYQQQQHDTETRVLRARLDRSSLAEADAFEALAERLAREGGRRV